MNDVTKIDDHTRGQQTRFLSREFVIGLVIQTVLVVGGGAFAYGTLSEKVEAQVQPTAMAAVQQKVAVLESKQIDAERVARLEVSMKNLEASLQRVQASLDRNFYDESPPRRK